jgi:hypothetical protein
MQTILAGRIETQERADRLMAQLRERGVALADMQAFYVNQPGQHAQFPIGGDEYADEAAQDAHKGQAAGAAVGAAAGLVAGGVAAVAVPPLAPVIVAGVTGVGALAGSIAGAVSAAKEPHEMGQTPADQQTHAQQGGLMLAVRATPDTEDAIVEAMRAAGIEHVERTRGQWRDGHWVDFDPSQPPESVRR